MARIFRWVVRLTVAGLVLAVAGVLLAWWLAARSLPDYEGTYEVAGISGEVRIIRDRHAIPHIFAENDADVFFGLGFAHAQDRLWQMFMLRRTVQGRLSELFGPRTLRIDELMRRLDLHGHAARSLAVQTPETRRALEAYAAGVNAWLAEVNRGARGRGAPEFFLFPARIALWQPADSLAILNLMALQLSGQLRREVLLAELSLVLPPERVRDLLPPSPGPAIAALPRYADLFPRIRPEVARRQATRAAAFDPLPAPGLEGASNAWAVGPSRSVTGASLLANDPHLELTAPSIWYLARLELASGGVIGGTIPGMPLVLVGRKADLAWGLTTAYADDQDIMIERLDPDDPSRYLTPEGWKPFRTARSIIRVKGQEPITITLRWSENGPILPGTQLGLGRVTPAGHVAALAWPALTDANTSMSAALALMRAGSVKEALAAARAHVAPVQNLIVADRTHVALKTVGRIPLRDPDHQTRGRLPAPGWKPENRWVGFLPHEDNPGVVDPEGGIVVNTNNRTVDRPFPRHVSYDWGDTERILRAAKLLGSRPVHSRESMTEAQLDIVSPTARRLLPLVARELWFTGEPAPHGTPERRRQDALALLAEWNGEMSEHLPEPLIYAAWMRELMSLLIRDELGPLADRFTHPEPTFIARVFGDVDGAGQWCDIRQSSPRESCAEIARRALDAALIELSERFGPDVASWRWGDAHEATHDHPVLGEVPILRWFVNIRQPTSGGDNTLMRGKTRGTDPDPFANVHAGAYRGVYDLADPEASLFIISTGQSGHFLSRHYDDLAELWRRGEYLPMRLDRALAQAGTEGITRLRPTAR